MAQYNLNLLLMHWTKLLAMGFACSFSVANMVLVCDGMDRRGILLEEWAYCRRLHNRKITVPEPRSCAQASQAAIGLQHNIAAESAAIVGFLDMYHAAITAHQAVRGKLAAWPDYIQPFRLMEYLGVLPRQGGDVSRRRRRCC